MSITVDFSSLNAICPEEQIVVYGYTECMHTAVILKIQQAKAKRVFEWAIGTGRGDVDDLTTLEGTELVQLKVDRSSKYIARSCKAALTTIVYENYRRIEANKERKAKGLSPLPLIPVLVCADIDGNRYAYDPQNIASKDPAANERLTHSELRRAAKLACTFPNAAVRAAARETFRFVKVKKITAEASSDTKLAFEKIAAPWEHPGWDKAWAERAEISKKEKAEGKVSKKNEFPWRKELESLIGAPSDAPSASKEREEKKS